MNPWLKIIRPVNGIMGVVATFISGFIGAGFSLVDFLRFIVIAALAVFLVTSGGNIINDVVDVDTDRINHPHRPLVTGHISIKSAKTGVAVMFAAAIVMSVILISPLAGAVVVIAEAFLLGYELKTKKLGLSGNVMISVLVGLIFIFGGIAVNSIDRMLILFLMATLANLSREVIKDIQDIKGDVDRMTLPKKRGIRFAAYFASASVILAVIISYFPYYLKIFGIYYLISVAFSDALFLASVAMIPRDPEKSQQVSKLAMIIGLASFAVGGIS